MTSRRGGNPVWDVSSPPRAGSWLEMRGGKLAVLALCLFLGLVECIVLVGVWHHGTAHGAASGKATSMGALLASKGAPGVWGAQEASDDPTLASGCGAYADPEDIPKWSVPPEHLNKFVAVFQSGTNEKEAVAWARTSRLWRRGIPAVVVATASPPHQTLVEAESGGEMWVEHVPKRRIAMEPRDAMLALTPSLAAGELRDSEFSWMLFGDVGTMFNLDVVIELVKDLDPMQPHLVTDNLYHAYNGTGPRDSSELGSHMAPRCVKCNGRPGEVTGHPTWRPAHACPACTWGLLRKWDPQRPEAYVANVEYNGVSPPLGDVAVLPGAGMLLSRGLLEMLPLQYMEECLDARFRDRERLAGNVLLSHCIFYRGVAPLDPGPFASDPRVHAFGPPDYHARGVMDDIFNFAQGPDCCNDLCQKRLAFTAAVALEPGRFINKYSFREAVRSMQRVRDAFRFTRDFGLDEGTRSVDGRKECR